MNSEQSHLKNIWLFLFFAVFIWSAIGPKDYFTWFLEVVPAVIALAVLGFTYKKFPLTSLVYVLILIHCLILMIGGHYTYAEVPYFYFQNEVSGISRNNFDKVGHFAQGFVPAMVAREIVIRKKIISGVYWQAFFVVSFCLAFSAFYELIEWWVALLVGEDAEAFLGTQGYVWDTQSDMGFALLGAIVAIILLSKFHNRLLEKF